MADDDQRAAPRYAVDTPVRGSTRSEQFQGRLKDVSRTGAAVVGIGDVGYDNFQFVSLHMEGIGEMSGQIQRRIPDGFALQFNEEDEDEKRKLEAAARAMIGTRPIYG
jgi:hypothetical protein